MRVGYRWSTLLVLALACKGSEQKPAETAPPPAAPAMADSLALTAPRGVEVWFTYSRGAIGADGQHCVERVMEIRREGKKIPVPLLYTGGRPKLVNDSTIQADIWLHCKPGNTYRVDLQTGMPTRVMP